MSARLLRDQLRERLIPLASGAVSSAATGSDYDLNPWAERSVASLRAAAVLVPVIARTDGATVLLTRRADSLTSHTGQIAFPGGRLDPGEGVVQAAIREAYEEVALDPAEVEPLGLGDPYETVTGFLVTPVVAWLASPPVTVPAPAEVSEVFEVPWKFLMNPANHRRDFYEPDGQPRRHFWAMPWEERYIWGATAGILRALCDRVYGERAAAGREVA